jgi:hypothetical protein
MRVFLVSFIASKRQLHDRAKGALEMRTACFMHDVMCIGVNDPYLICEMQVRLRRPTFVHRRLGRKHDQMTTERS